MRILSYSFISLFLLAGLAAPQDAPDPFLIEKGLPPETCFYLSVPHDPARGAEFALSNLRKFLTHPEIRGFVEPIEKYAYNRIRKDRFIRGATDPSLNKMVRDQLGLSLDEIAELAIGGPLSLALIDIPINGEHTFDVVLGVGASEPQKLQDALTKIRKRLMAQDLELSEGEFEYKKHTIKELGAEYFSIYYTIVGKTAVVTTSQPRMEGIIDGLKNNLRTYKPFETIRSKVSPKGRHLVFGYVGVEAILRMFRKEIGDEALGILEQLGIRDITAVGGALDYNVPFIRERFAVATSRQDRGLVKLLAGKGGRDAAAKFVPAEAVEYGNVNASLTDLYDMAMFGDIQEMVQGYENRLGLDLKKDLFSRIGPSWTSYSMFPKSGGAYPDSIFITELRESEAFFKAIDKITEDAGLKKDTIEFEGETIRTLQMELPEFMGTGIAFLEKDGMLFLSSNALALKRQVLRFSQEIRPKSEERSFQTMAARLPQGPDAFLFFDIGKMFTFGYNTLEPFAHYLRDFARDPDTGEYIIDLARLPLGETVGELLGATYSVKSTEDGVITIQSLSNTGVTPVTTMVFVATVAAVAIPAMLRGAEPPGIFGPAENERRAQLSLQSIRIAQSVFRMSDMDRNGKEDYWKKDIAGLYGIKDKNDNRIFLIDVELAAADPSGARAYGLKSAPKNGYWFQAVTGGKDWAIEAWPAAYGVTGGNTFLMDADGHVWKKDTGGKPVGKWPESPEKAGWTKAD